MAQLFIQWCSSPLAILKHLQILCSIIIVLFLMDGRSQWWPYTLIFLGAIFLGLLSFFTLILYFLRIHKQSANKFPWIAIEITFNLLAVIVSVIFTGILAYDYYKISNGRWAHHKHLPAPNIGSDGWAHRILVIAIVEALNTAFYAFSLYRTKAYGIQ